MSAPIAPTDQAPAAAETPAAETPAAPDAVKPKFIYLPIVGRGEQIRLLLAEHGMEVDFVLPKGFGGEYVWQDQAVHGTLHSNETGEDGLVLSDSSTIIDYIFEKVGLDCWREATAKDRSSWRSAATTASRPLYSENKFQVVASPLAYLTYFPLASLIADP